jgi:K+-sensing histidine kinase KdpD
VLASALLALLLVKPHFSFLATVFQAMVAMAVLVAMAATPLAVAMPVGVCLQAPFAAALCWWSM